MYSGSSPNQRSEKKQDKIEAARSWTTDVGVTERSTSTLRKRTGRNLSKSGNEDINAQLGASWVDSYTAGIRHQGSDRNEQNTEDCISSPTIVYVHLVQPSDTLAGIVLRYNIPADIVRRANRLWYTANDIQIKKVLLLPARECKIRYNIDRRKLDFPEAEKELKALHLKYSIEGGNDIPGVGTVAVVRVSQTALAIFPPGQQGKSLLSRPDDLKNGISEPRKSTDSQKSIGGVIEEALQKVVKAFVNEDEAWKTPDIEL
ncbi:hypothetical protein CANCADRAFT_115790 [Tortispora caseinolytica NRRL Y-17796]|uniref:LysM domain-containing protein n=1 Tax=Tortispora caseinolytica NRRL Y-17796 TaxID=767744 RepID=A0A1E4TH00_9ASCO|nr:hypothetical protein CANCADRAFT_115790 [Tortispora caseinolytica NRRL Y-17796]